ncbi:DNA repair exonuclease [Candidatus Pacearchaeota archaeon]|nr:DNA repair exonuclease [Candidatus Pacearchaeota archaeon]
MKFAHMGDCHLGGWRFPELQELNFQSFSKALDIAVKEEVDMILITGDLFDSAYPPIDILKRTFAEFRKIKEAKIPCFLIAGSHDYSVSGKTFLEVLEHAGFCKNTFISEEREGKIYLQPTIFQEYAIYGYPGMKSGLEVPGLKKIILQDAPGFFKIFMLHTTLTEAIGSLPIDSISINELPKADYYALGHLHVDFTEENVVYSGPIYPNNFEELEEMKHGQFYLVEYDPISKSVNKTKIPLQIKDTIILNVELDNSLTATEKIISELDRNSIEDKIVLLRLSGKFKSGKISDIRFQEIENFSKDKKVYCLIRNTSRLKLEESKISIEIKDMHEVEDSIIKDHFSSNIKFGDKISPLLKALSIEKQEDEKNQIFEDRLMSELKNILNF